MQDHSLVESTAARLDASNSRQIDIRLTNLEKDVSEIKRIALDMSQKLNMVVMVMESQREVNALNVLSESHRNDGYDYKVLLTKHSMR